MQKVFDYAGNEIKEGQEIVLVMILEIIPQWGYVVPGTGLTYTSDKVPDKDCFEVGQTLKIICQPETMNELGYCTKAKSRDGEYSFTHYDTIENLKIMWMPSTSIIAIKGISDTKEYYDTWKQKQSNHLQKS